MKSAILFALVALVPASVNAAPPAQTEITVATCAGGERTITVPMQPDAPARRDAQPCCAKGCHTECSRKRNRRAS